MSERVDQIVAEFERRNAEAIEFISRLNESELTAPCDDPAGTTVGDTVAHLAHGVAPALQWVSVTLTGATDESTAAADGGHSHGHSDSHGDLVGEAVRQLRHWDQTMTSMLRELTDERLDSVPPAAEGITDGNTPLGQILTFLSAHLTEHLEFMKNALAARANNTSPQEAQ